MSQDMSETPEGQNESGVKESAAEPKPPRRWGNGFLSLCGNLQVPGLGHLLVGQPKRAAFCFALCFAVFLLAWIVLATPILVPAALVVIPIQLLVGLWVLLDGYLRARRSRTVVFRFAWLRYGIGIGLIAVFAGSGVWERLMMFTRDRVVDNLRVAGPAMSPTLVDGDCILCHKRAGVERWAIVLITHPDYGERSVVTRIVGLPGETIEIIDGEIHIGGKSAARPSGVEAYTQATYPRFAGPAIRGKPGAGCRGNPITLADDEYYVLGDNSGRALDSRCWMTRAGSHQLGALPGSHILGRITYRYWPMERWQRF